VTIDGMMKNLISMKVAGKKVEIGSVNQNY